MRLVGLVESKPKKNIRLDPMDPQDLNVDLSVVKQWSNQNQQLMHLILQNGMATFICNYQFLYQFYKSLIFNQKQITSINSSSLNFLNLKVLNLCQNKIKILQNIPQNCQQLYLDFNQIDQINFKSKSSNNNKLLLLSLSHNFISDHLLKKICDIFKSLRCLNVSSNKIQNIRTFVQNIKRLPFIKILNSIKNPISLLKIYYQYITTNVQLKVFDNQKYLKPQSPKKKKEEIKPPQPPKQQKKDVKKDAKKGGKVQEKPVQVVVPVIQQKKQQPKQLTQEDFIKMRLNITISNFQNFIGVLYESSIFGVQNIDIKKCQSTYWLTYFLLGKKFQTYQKRVRFDSITSENDQNRLDFAESIKQQLSINTQNLRLFQQGLVIYVYKEQPIVLTDPETMELKPQLSNNEPAMRRQLIGSVFVDLRQLILLKQKKIQRKFSLWRQQTANKPLFKDKYLDQKAQIQKRKQELQQRLKKQLEENKKKLQQQEALKAQKKGKDNKKAADKKPPPAKKDGKQPINEQKKKVQKCDFPIEDRKYAYLGGDSLQKISQELLAIKLQVQ